MTFEHPLNAHRETVSVPAAVLLFLLLGPIWSAWRQLWGLAVAHLLLAFVLGAIAVPLAALSSLLLVWVVPGALRRHFLRAGWREIDAPQDATAPRPTVWDRPDSERRMSPRVTIDR